MNYILPQCIIIEEDINYKIISKSMATDFVTPLMQIGEKIADYFLNKREQKDAIQNISRDDVGEFISRPLVDMHAALVKVDTVLDVYANLLQITDGQFKVTLQQYQSSEFFSRASQYMQEFWDNISLLEGRRNGDKVMESVKGNACAGNARLTDELRSKTKQYDDIRSAGGQPTSIDIRNVILAYRSFTACFINGVAAAIEDLAHAGRMLP